MKKIFIISILLFSFSLLCSFTLKGKLINAKVGQYIIFDQHKMYTILSIYKKTNTSLIIEEASILKNQIKKDLLKTWFETEAKNASSHIIYEIDLNKNKIVNSYSFTKKAYINLKDEDNFLTMFLNLNLKKLTLQDRKKIGPRLSEEEKDKRKVFNPTKIKDQKKIKNAIFDVYRSYFPENSSYFSNNKIEFYFDVEDFFFPYFIEIDTENISIIIKAIDSGDNIKSSIVRLENVNRSFF
jgi:hypothetical protein